VSVTFVYCVETAKDTASYYIMQIGKVPKLTKGTILNDHE